MYQNADEIPPKGGTTYGRIVWGGIRVAWSSFERYVVPPLGGLVGAWKVPRGLSLRDARI